MTNTIKMKCITIFTFLSSYLKGHKIGFIFSDYGKKCIKENNLTSV